MYCMLHLLRHSRLKLYYSTAESISWLQAKKFIILVKYNDSHLWNDVLNYEYMLNNLKFYITMLTRQMF